MILIDNNFNEINNEDKKEFDEILIETMSHLNKLILDEKTKKIISDNSKDVIIQLIDNYNYSIKLPNGTLRTMKFPNSAGALKANMYNEINDSEIHIIPGIALRSNYSKHQVVHELLHTLSFNQHNYFDENGITYTKTGTKIDFYDKDTNDYIVENNPSSDGLNEGITELLTSVITNDYNGNYSPFVAISKLFLEANPNLINAYFSRNLNDIGKFYDDLEENQSIITRNDLMNLSSRETNPNVLSKIINGAISYNKACNPNFSENNLNGMITYLDSNFMLDTGSWSGLVSINNKKEF